MKRILYFLICAVTMLSCDKLPANGDLDGMWQIMEIEHGDSIVNMKQRQVYMSIQLKLFQLDEVKYSRRYVGYFERQGKTLRFWRFSFYSHNEKDSDDNVLMSTEDMPRLYPFGFHALDETFTIDKLTKDDLVLRNDSTVIRYIKF